MIHRGLIISVMQVRKGGRKEGEGLRREGGGRRRVEGRKGGGGRGREEGREGGRWEEVEGERRRRRGRRDFEDYLFYVLQAVFCAMFYFAAVALYEGVLMVG